MDDLGFNKIAGAFLAVALAMLVLMKLPGVVMGGDDETIAYSVGTVDTDPNPGPPVDLPFPQPKWVAAMDATKGAKVFKKCQSCHNVEAGGANGTGPNLYALIGKDIASKDGYGYSAALEGLPGEWGYEELDGYLTRPSAYAPGTAMNFIGLKKPEDRAAVIEYLRVSAPTPEPRPEPKTVNAETMDETIETDLEEPTVNTEQSMEQDTVDPTTPTIGGAEELQ